MPLGCDGSTELVRQAFQNLEKLMHLVIVPENNDMQDSSTGLKIQSLCYVVCVYVERYMAFVCA